MGSGLILPLRPGAGNQPMESETTVSTSTVFVVDDDPAMRKSLCWLIESVGLAVETFESAQAFLDAYDSNRSGCLVLDMRMPGMSGLELQDRLRDNGVDLPAIIVTGYGDVPTAVRAMKRGAVDFMEKPFSDQILLNRIQDALKRDLDRRALRKRVAAVAACAERLSPREREVMDRVVQGKPNKVIAAELGLSPKTIEVHRARVMEKMEARSLADLIRLNITLQHGDDDPSG